MENRGEKLAKAHLSKLFLPIMVTVRSTLMLSQHIQGWWHRIETRETNLQIRNYQSILEQWRSFTHRRHKERYKYGPFLLRHVVPLQLTHQFFHNSLYQDYTAGSIHCKEQNTLPCEEDKAIEQESQAAKQENATMF